MVSDRVRDEAWVPQSALLWNAELVICRGLLPSTRAVQMLAVRKLPSGSIGHCVNAISRPSGENDGFP